jgi:DNA polymerase-3 subunit gamma/tau
MARFLRNATVAKIAGKDSPLLQISSEERERVGHIADLFSEEDLTRHLQIILRTHNELGYKQEQRFHLELGLLKMSHAQKLLPLEQLLSDAAATPPISPQRPAGRPAIVSGTSGSEARRPETPAARSNFVSPFAADSARKTPRQEASFDSAAPAGPRIVATVSVSEPVIMGSAVPDRRDAAPVAAPDGAIQQVPAANPNDASTGTGASSEIANATTGKGTSSTRADKNAEDNGALAPEGRQATAAQPEIDRLQASVLQALVDGNQRILASMLSAGEWSVQGNELVVKISESQTVVDMSLGGDAKRLAIAAASGVLGRAVKLKVVPGAALAQENKRNGGLPASSGPGGRGRAEEDPVVRRMREKFGAEIRTVIDYREKR